MWKPIEDYEGLYEVSAGGEVRRVGGGILKLQKETHGYASVSLSKNGKRISRKVHRLVAKAFIPNPYGYNVINHKDGDKKNNSAANLEWTTSAQNNQHSWDIGRNHNTEKQREAARRTIGFAREVRLQRLAGGGS
jgi:hypothetical protein